MLGIFNVFGFGFGFDFGFDFDFDFVKNLPVHLLKYLSIISARKASSV